MRRAEVRMFGRRAGVLEETERGYVFTYDRQYVSSPDSLPVSLLMPLREDPYQDKRLFPFFDGLIPEGWLLFIAEKTWKLSEKDRMGLLMACCRDCIGAAGIIPIETAEK